MKTIVSKLLRTCERLYLYVHGWRSLPSPDIHGRYLPPPDYPLERKPEYVRTHAVNAQRQVYAKATKERKAKLPNATVNK